MTASTPNTPASNEAPGRGGVDEDTARELYRAHCNPGERGALERYGEEAAVAAIMGVAQAAQTPRADLIEELVSALEDLNNHIGDDMIDSRAKRIAELRVLAARSERRA